jgi:hypothetical protein
LGTAEGQRILLPGAQTQLRHLFVDHTALQDTFAVGGVQLAMQQTPGDLRGAGVTGCVVWNGAVVLGAAMERWDR